MSDPANLRLDNPLVVRWEYASEERLRVRNAIFDDLVAGEHPEEVTFAAVREVAPERVLEVGCGTGEFALRIQTELDTEVVAIDLSSRMVGLARGLGLDAHVGDAQALELPDASFDCVVANWVLYHLPDLAAGIAELARVLRPGGRLVAATIGTSNIPEVWALVGETPDPPHSFNSETGEELLRRSFAHVERREARGRVRFRDHQAVRDLVAATITRAHLAARVPDFEGELLASTHHAVFVAEKTR